MKLKVILASGTALALLSATGLALAADNLSIVNQSGDDNAIDVVQAGTSNSVGSVGAPGTSADQNGDRNTMEIAQTSGATGAGNAVSSVNQTGSVGASGVTNSLTIEQDNTVVAGTGNMVGTVTQTYTGTTGGTSEDNQAGIVQIGNGNTVTALSQIGTNNIAAVRMGWSTDTANGNTLTLLSQSGTGQQAGVVITGDNNGGGALNDEFVSLLGLAPSEIIQADSRNFARLHISGDGNQFGIVQGTGGGGGSDNTIGTVTISGTSNQLAIEQLNNNNFLGLAEVAGSNNDIAVTQDGDHQEANVTVLGSANHALVKQFSWNTNDASPVDNNNLANLYVDGADNYTIIVQNGDKLLGYADAQDNTSDIRVEGSRNYTGTIQLGAGSSSDIDVTGNDNGVIGIQLATGASNTIDVDVVGGNNNKPASPLTGFSAGVTSTLAAASGTMTAALGTPLATEINAAFNVSTNGNALQPGVLIQKGSGNTLNLSVGAVSASSGNLFATLQVGDGNTINGSIEGGSNEAAILQAGSSNTATFSQNGTGNAVAISQ